MGSRDEDSSRGRRGRICIVKSRGGDVRAQTVECSVSVAPVHVLASTTLAELMQSVSLESLRFSVFQFTTRAHRNIQIDPLRGLGRKKGDPQEIKCCHVSELGWRLIFFSFFSDLL